LDFDISRTGAHIRHKGAAAFAVFKNYQLHTAVQPIFSLAHKRIVGYEALARIKDVSEKFVSPLTLFNPDQSQSDIVFLDRLCRHLHLYNFARLNDEVNWLFLNVSPHTIANSDVYGTFFRELLEARHFPSERIVIEIVEHPISNNEMLLKTVDFYKNLGCLIAIDDFGAGQSNFDRIWSLSPDIVKVDRAMLLKASGNKSIRNLLSGIISLLHQAGALVLIEGIETQDQAMIALESDADFVQGYFFAKPTMELDQSLLPDCSFEELFIEYKEKVALSEKTTIKSYKRYAELFQQVISGIKNRLNWTEACDVLLEDKNVVRCYLLAPSGVQIGSTKTNAHFFGQSDARFRPLEEANSADWFRRHYLRRAIVHPNQMQITRPYLSITGAHMCITLSMMFSSPNGLRVLCCDLNWDDKKESLP
jgi:EAL domain-containing protein (putative c-di-GMP-specific phosphodiesterase class I)